ncbi:Astacin-like metalloendopeptidase [Strongyloides ratti]|uniref:Metalloendopeptidase n=1 Tax=Strongyloides ratti TaxID=34506 RepID=A0A090N014_STRRB|nr:Astacin-like metalloendopeptidase [Strongyloides ratti]CEF69890.2 Astacin-like metalloendopeptidase [Strongyloides ratti]
MLNYYNIILYLNILSIPVNTFLYQGKIEIDNLSRKKKSVVQTKFKWKLPIKYFIHYFLYERKAIYEAIKRIENKTCIKFKEHYWYIKGTSGFNFIPTYTACFSPYGPKLDDESFENNIFVAPRCQNSVGLVEGLIGTMIGLIYEVGRYDRDSYVNINYENMLARVDNLFKKHNLSETETYGTEYDFLSALQYFPKNFSKNGKPVVEPKDFFKYYQNSIGQTKGLSFNDYKVLTLKYCHEKIHYNCKNGGYTDVNYAYKGFYDWGDCICPSGFSGSTCEENVRNDRTCGETVLDESSIGKMIYASRTGKCSYFIKFQRPLKVKLTIIEISTKTNEYCSPGIGIEIKFRKDKGAGGACLCGKYKNITITSENNFMVIIYNGLSSNDKFTATFDKVLRESSGKKINKFKKN